MALFACQSASVKPRGLLMGGLEIGPYSAGGTIDNENRLMDILLGNPNIAGLRAW